VVGSHVDSVPDGGWLDGALGVMAGVGVLRAHADQPPARDLFLVDWADEEGARFGRSLFGSSAFSGSLDPEAVGGLRDAQGRTISEVLEVFGVELEHVLECGRRRQGLGAYLELHIEQGPRMEASGIRVAAVTGCAGVERVRFRFKGQTSHAGTTPMELRRDAGLAAAEAALAIERLPAGEGGVTTTGELRVAPGIPTAIPGEAVISADLRHPEADALARMLEAARAAAVAGAGAHGCELEEEPLWRIEPIPFDPGLVVHAREAAAEVAGEAHELASGALHDAAEVARVMPAVMMFCPSIGGISHARDENTADEDLALAIEAYGVLAERVLRV
jgi:N-carbamoyl-L-amino-acid hydrolase